MDENDIEDFGAELEDLGRGLAQTGRLTESFSQQLDRTRRALAPTVRDLGDLERGFSTGVRRAFEGLVFEGKTLTDTLRGLGQAMSRTAYREAVNPVADHLGGLLSSGVNAAVSGIMPQGSVARVTPFARGGVVTGPTRFPMTDGRSGLVGEAGPEAILPLSRGADGTLGVRAGGGTRPVQVTMHVTTPDAEGFRRSRGQIAAELGRAVAHGARNR
ncbi:phage tail tape measure protein [Histidinibacterium aquaticum]|uniref:Phage tail tape measure protein n=1 Tax=Histidinibacterium aquaticum TaxID=2613962 RepID=A0A5J5GL60_9RHOB|nr:phage tail tape measure protein [Histidinibacterium aquaticum]KAA9009039.1 phage tail tape measure protein [Histidinibacterium aquaticum]